MGIKSYAPVTPTLRYKTTNTFEEVTTDKPYKPLLISSTKISGRNNTGSIMVRRRGGGHKRRIRIVDNVRIKHHIPAVVETIEYDPNRSSYIALVKYSDGERRYVLATTNMKVGMKIMSGENCEIAEGNHMPLRNIPPGVMIHNIEIREGKGGQVVRSAGSYAQILAKEGNLVQIKLPSGEIRNFRETCYATIGQVSNTDHMNIILGSAGRSRWLGIRPHVRGVAMNPVDHPMGGGEGKSKGGGGWHHPVSPWGQKSKGLKTRNRKKTSSKYIIKSRKSKG
jgi:large subunit ribosomal protein L2